MDTQLRWSNCSDMRSQLTEMNDPGRKSKVAVDTNWVSSLPSLCPSFRISLAVALSSAAERLKACENGQPGSQMAKKEEEEEQQDEDEPERAITNLISFCSLLSKAAARSCRFSKNL